MTEALYVSQVIDATVIKLEDRGVYVSYDGLVGFIDVIELSWVPYRDGVFRFYKVGQPLRVKVLCCDSNQFYDRRQFYDFYASVKELYPERNPWLYTALFEVGTTHEVAVRDVLDFGYIICLGFGINALLPLSGIEKTFKVGDFIVVKIISVNKRKIVVELVSFLALSAQR